VSNVVRALAWRVRACTVSMSAPLHRLRFSGVISVAASFAARCSAKRVASTNRARPRAKQGPINYSDADEVVRTR
jgi:hypothetical protein